MYNLVDKKNHYKANILFYKNDIDNALILYFKLINNNYHIDIIYSNISACYLKYKNYIKSLKYSLKSLQKNCTYAVAWGRVGYSYKGLNMHYNAYQAFINANLYNKYNKLYNKEINFYYIKYSNDISISSIYKLILYDKTLLNKIKNIKNINDINKNINSLIELVLQKL